MMDQADINKAVYEMQGNLKNEARMMIADVLTRFGLPQDENLATEIVKVADEYLIEVERHATHGSLIHLQLLNVAWKNSYDMRTALRNL